jgi:hypothetical protein
LGATRHIPARQNPYELALQVGFETLLSRAPADDRLRALGADRQSDTIRIAALNRSLVVDLGARDVFVDGIGKARRAWAVLAVHYLAAADVSSDTREVAFAHFADCRGYLNVFEKRIVGRFLATAGRTAERFGELAGQLHGERVPGPGDGYRFDVLPRVPIVIVRHEGDAELGPGASVIYRADIRHLLPAEDRVVATELLLDSLAGKTIEESPGGPR